MLHYTQRSGRLKRAARGWHQLLYHYMLEEKD